MNKELENKPICFASDYNNGEKQDVKAFRSIVNEMLDTYVKKNHDYGNAYESGFAKFGPVQLLSRIYEKYERLYNILYKSVTVEVSDETICDTLTDMAAQCVILRMLIEGSNVVPVDFENVK